MPVRKSWCMRTSLGQASALRLDKSQKRARRVENTARSLIFEFLLNMRNSRCIRPYFCRVSVSIESAAYQLFFMRLENLA
jgi:hypothetical protein